MKKKFINGKRYTLKKENVVIEVIYEIEQGIMITDFWLNEINNGIKLHVFGIPAKLKEKEIKEYIELIKITYMEPLLQRLYKIEKLYEIETI